MKLFELIPSVSAILALSLGACSSDSNKITTPSSSNAEPSNHALAPYFKKHTRVFGIDILGTSSTPDVKIMHAANVMAEYLDNDEDGIPDNQAVVDHMVAQKSALLMFKDNAEAEAKMSVLETKVTNNDALQDLYASETHPNSSDGGKFDATLEEVLHLITHVGFAGVYPGVFGEQTGSAISDAMDIARGGQFETIPASYPSGAWYTYNDESCDYSCMVTEYTYWSLTSILGAQHASGRLEDIQQEWKLNTKDKVQAHDTAVYTILTDGQYGLPSTLPNGSYQAKQFTVTLNSDIKDDEPKDELSDSEILQNALNANPGYKIAFGNLDDIYMMNPDGSERVLLADGKPISGYVAWSHDAQYVYFASAKGEAESAWEAFRVNVTTKALTKLTEFGQDVRSIGLSPDGQYLALSIMTGNSNIGDNNDNLTLFNSDIYIIELSTAEPIWTSGGALRKEDMRLLVGAEPAEQFWFEELNWNPSLSDDGDEAELAYTKTWRYDEDDVSYTHAYNIRADGSDPQLIAENKDQPIWAFDDEIICFLDMSCYSKEQNQSVQLNITGIDNEVSAASISPDGEYVLFEVGDENRKAGIAELNISGPSKGVIIESNNAYEPRWSPTPVASGA